MAELRTPAWARWTTFGLSLGGLTISAYLTVEHFTAGATLACPETGIVNCQKVTSSAQATQLGVPVAVWGLLYFAALAAVTSPPAWRRTALDRARIGLAVAGVAAVFYLIYVELFVVDAICLWCTVIHALTIALFAVVLVERAGRPQTGGSP